MRRLLPLLFLLLCGCPGEKKPDLKANVKLADPPAASASLEAPALLGLIPLASKAMEAGKPMPVRFSCQGENVSPPLNWGKLPEGTRSVALIAEDLDVPARFIHWLLYNVPPEISQLPDDLPKAETVSIGALQGQNGFRLMGYGGPCPPPGKAHRYLFRLFALDAMLPVEPGAGHKEIEAAMQGHLLGRGDFLVTYGR